ncbi:ATP-binding protein [Promethearchaeum syntrophicum]|uniref:histidine kinase n=1 Tax=Promethearchaeum syntrophicum TaxID=2594042 RepID=A0A5B9DCW9_9ARCH|nr:ATP-binding protein [Candidatus Prometheoarchaeum syntrophicum]
MSFSNFSFKPSSSESIHLKVGAYENSPKIFTNEQGEIDGFFPSILGHIADKEGWELEYIHGNWSESLALLKANQIDILPDVGFSYDRQMEYDFNNESAITGWGIAYTHDESDIYSMQDLKNKKIGVMKDDINYIGPLGIKIISDQNRLNCTFVEYDSLEDVLTSLNLKIVDVGIVNEFFGNLNAYKFDVKKTSIAFNPIDFKFAFPKNASLNSFLIEKIDNWLKTSKSDLDSIYYQEAEIYLSDQESSIPSWIFPSFLILIGLAAFLTISAMTLRYQVKIRTKSLHDLNQELSTESIQKKNQLANIVENSNDGIISAELDGTIRSWNKSAEVIFGFSSEEIIGKKLDLIIPSNRFNEVKYIIDKIKQGEPVNHFETKLMRNDGKLLDISITASPLKNLKGKINGFSAIGRDFTETIERQKLYQDQILKASKFKSDFMASMSHELRTPLNSIIGFTDVILERISGEINEEQDKYLTHVKTSAMLLLDLINDILDITKIESGKMELNIEEVNLSQIISQVDTMIKPIYMKKSLIFEVQEIDKEKVIRVDRLRFKEILFNLLSNAVKYTKEGKIMIKFSEEEEFWKFDVIDTGIGIKKENFDILFKDFRRIASKYVVATEGTGLGLSLSKRLVEFHGGTISFTSTFGKGSKFTFTIPKQL